MGAERTPINKALRRADLIGDGYLNGLDQTVALYNTHTLPIIEKLLSRNMSTLIEHAIAAILTAGLLIIGFLSVVYLLRKKDKRIEV